MAWADEIKEIKTVCHCGKKAIMNARVSAAGDMETEGAQIEIGGNERYVHYAGVVSPGEKPEQERCEVSV